MDSTDRGICSPIILNKVSQIPCTFERIHILSHYRTGFQYLYLERHDAGIRTLLLYPDVDDEYLHFSYIYYRPDIFRAIERNCCDVCISLCLCAHGVYYDFHQSFGFVRDTGSYTVVIILSAIDFRYRHLGSHICHPLDSISYQLAVGLRL